MGWFIATVCVCTSEFILTFGNFGIGHGVAAKRTFFGLDAHVGHGLSGGAFEITVAVSRYADHRSFRHIKHITSHLELTFSAQNNVILLIFLMAVKERNGRSGGEGSE